MASNWEDEFVKLKTYIEIALKDCNEPDKMGCHLHHIKYRLTVIEKDMPALISKERKNAVKNTLQVLHNKRLLSCRREAYFSVVDFQGSDFDDLVDKVVKLPRFILALSDSIEKLLREFEVDEISGGTSYQAKICVEAEERRKQALAELGIEEDKNMHANERDDEQAKKAVRDWQNDGKALLAQKKEFVEFLKKVETDCYYPEEYEDAITNKISSLEKELK